MLRVEWQNGLNSNVTTGHSIETCCRPALFFMKPLLKNNAGAWKTCDYAIINKSKKISMNDENAVDEILFVNFWKIRQTVE